MDERMDVEPSDEDMEARAAEERAKVEGRCCHFCGDAAAFLFRDFPVCARIPCGTRTTTEEWAR